MARGTSRFDDVIGCWVVEDEQGNIWTAVTTGDRAMLVECEDSQRYYGAVWAGRAGGTGEFYPRSDGDIEDGYDCNQRYEFSETGGWKMLDQQDAGGEGGDS